MRYENPASRKPGFKITELYAFIALDQEFDEEGVPAFSTPNRIMFPLIAADEDRLKSLRPVAREMAKASGQKITLARFSLRENIEEILP